MAAPACTHCHQPARLTDGREVYPRRADLAELRFWVCDPCGARVGCHKDGAVTDKGTSDGTMALGTPANAELRRARGLLHKRLDPIWRAATKRDRRTARRRTYRVIARALSIPMERSHVGMFDIEQCRAAYRVLIGLTTERVLADGRYDPEQDAEREEAA